MKLYPAYQRIYNKVIYEWYSLQCQVSLKFTLIGLYQVSNENCPTKMYMIHVQPKHSF